MVFDDATTLGASIGAGAETSYDICSSFLDRIDAKNSLLNAVIDRRPRADILFDAAASDARRSAGTRLSPLDGVPFTLKACLETEGLRTTTGTFQVDYIPGVGRSCDIARILKAAGCILIGKTNAPGGPVYTEPVNLGRCKNPYDTGRATGGSSGGSAAAVASGFTGFDVGTDAAGSVRMPASWCGVYGLKPTFGAIPNFGDIWPITRDRPPVYRDLCVPGPIARSLDDLSTLLQILNKPTRDCADVHPVRPLVTRPLQKVVVIDKIGPWYCDPTVQAAVEQLVDALELAGVTVIRTGAFPLTEARFLATYDGLWGQPSTAINANYPTINPHAADWTNNGLWADTTSAYGSHVSAHVEARKLLRTFMDWIADADVVLTPTHAVCAPTFGTTIENTITYMCMTVLYNMIGVPAVSIPLGTHATGTPFGLQVVGRPHDDLAVLDFAKEIDTHSCGFVAPSL